MIARELLVKLGFDIDSAKLDKFNASIDATKNKMQDIRSRTIQSISSVGGTKLANAISSERNKMSPKMGGYQFAAPLTKEEAMTEDELKESNKIKKQAAKETAQAEKQAAKEVTKTKKAELKKQENLDKEAVQKEKNLQEVRQKNLKNSMAAIASIRQKVAIIGASIVAGFGLSIRAALKDAANFKEGKSSAGTFDKNQLAVVDSFNKSLDTTKSLIANLRNSFVVDMLPAIKEVLDVFNKWLNENKVRILKKIKETVEAITEAFKMLKIVLKPLLSAFDYLIEKTVGWKILIKSVIVLGASAWFLSLASSVLVAARAFKVLIATSLIGRFVSVIKTIRDVGMAAWFRGLAAPILAAASAFRVFALAILNNPLTWIITGIGAALVFLVDELTAFRSGGKTTANLLKEWGGGWVFLGDGINIVYTNISKLIDAFKELQSIEILKSLGKVANPFAGITDNLLSNELFEKGVGKIWNNKSGKSGKFGQGNVKTFALPKYNPEEVSKVFRSDVTNNARTANVTHKNSFNMNITVPSGTEEKQAIYIGKVVKDELEKYNVFQTEQTLASIGSY